jgi:hypothetical protein
MANLWFGINLMQLLGNSFFAQYPGIFGQLHMHDVYCRIHENAIKLIPSKSVQ